jgi:hypothetical protein
MALFGWVVTFLGVIFLSLVYGVLCTQTLGRYNIGGVPNSAQSKICTLALGVLLVFSWMKIFQYAPFSIVIQ